MDHDNFLKKSIIKFNGYYKYSITKINKVEITCPLHGIFYQYPHHHLMSKIPCKKCRYDLNRKNKIKTFIIKSNEIHNNFYNYDESVYINNKIKIKIKCPLHGFFYQRPDMHIYQKQGCPSCYNESILNLNDFIYKSNKIHNNKYDYSLIKSLEKDVIIICSKHGKFKQRIYNHLIGQGCPNCNNSKGENIIEKYLIENNIKYDKQKKFDNCKNKRCLPFDFYLSEYNICIEYDGKYHYEDDYTMNNDKIKNEFCINNDIKLIRFNLTNIKNINNILNDFNKKHNH